MNTLNQIKNNIIVTVLIIVICAYSVYISHRFLDMWLSVHALEIRVSYYQGAQNMAFYRRCEKYNPDLIDLERLRGIDGFISCTGMNTYLDSFDDYNPELTDPKKPVEE